MQIGNLVRARQNNQDRPGNLAFIVDIAHYTAGTAVRILLNDGRVIWVGAVILEVVQCNPTVMININSSASCEEEA
jgi:hypothetical protein